MMLSNGGWSARMRADSVSEAGYRLTTMEVTFPRIVLSEFNTHRVFSRNSASSRAIPVERMIERVESNPFIPDYWGKNQKGMQADEELDQSSIGGANIEWELAKKQAILRAKNLVKLGVHKQIVNRLLEPFMWHTCIVTATEWSNFFALRCDSAAAPEIRNIALLMRDLYQQHTPNDVISGQYHLPYIDDTDWELLEWECPYPEAALKKAIELSVARCARVSYLTHDGKRDHQADYDLYTRLLTSRHMSPFEHVATPIQSYYEGDETYSGNFTGWNQFRKSIPYEDDASNLPKAL